MIAASGPADKKPFQKPFQVLSTSGQPPPKDSDHVSASRSGHKRATAGRSRITLIRGKNTTRSCSGQSATSTGRRGGAVVSCRPLIQRRERARVNRRRTLCSIAAGVQAVSGERGRML